MKRLSDHVTSLKSAFKLTGGIGHSNHYRSCYAGILLRIKTFYISFEDRTSVDFIHECPIFKWVWVTWPKWRVPGPGNRVVVPVMAARSMMTSSNGNIFRDTGHLCGEFTGRRWIPRTKASDAELWCFFDVPPNKQLSKQSWGWWSETPSCPLWRQCNEYAHHYRPKTWFQWIRQRQLQNKARNI